MLETLGALSRDSWHWFREKAESRGALWWFALYSFFDPTILPISFDPFLALLVLANRARAILLIAISSIVSLLGAVLGYFLSALFYTSVVAPFAAWGGFLSSIEALQVSTNELTFIAMFITALTPVSDPPLIIAAGLLRVDLVSFALAFFFGRTIRSILVVILTLFFGERIFAFFEKHANDRMWGLLTGVVLVALVGTAFLAFFI